MAVFIDLWPYLLTTKFKSVIRHNLGHSNVACTTLGESKGIYHFVKGCCTQALALLDSNDLTQRSVESN